MFTSLYQSAKQTYITIPILQVCTSAGSVTVLVTDKCPDCSANELNLHALAFEQIGHLEYGSAAIKYRQVRTSALPQ